jgi:hypothetical protein
MASAKIWALAILHASGFIIWLWLSNLAYSRCLCRSSLIIRSGLLCLGITLPTSSAASSSVSWEHHCIPWTCILRAVQPYYPTNMVYCFGSDSRPGYRRCLYCDAHTAVFREVIPFPHILKLVTPPFFYSAPCSYPRLSLV